MADTLTSGTLAGKLSNFRLPGCQYSLRVPRRAGGLKGSGADRLAEKSAADGALMISPYYNRPTQEDIYQHYKKVASQVGVPIIVYNIPGRTGSKIEPEKISEASKTPPARWTRRST